MACGANGAIGAPPPRIEFLKATCPNILTTNTTFLERVTQSLSILWQLYCYCRSFSRLRLTIFDSRCFQLNYLVHWIPNPLFISSISSTSYSRCRPINQSINQSFILNQAKQPYSLAASICFPVRNSVLFLSSLSCRRIYLTHADKHLCRVEWLLIF